ncbi:MAG: hypothetical protein ACLP1D_20645 [Xanthobacteraceae bacterium]
MDIAAHRPAATYLTLANKKQSQIVNSCMGVATPARVVAPDHSVADSSNSNPVLNRGFGGRNGLKPALFKKKISSLERFQEMRAALC